MLAATSKEIAATPWFTEVCFSTFGGAEMLASASAIAWSYAAVASYCCLIWALVSEGGVAS